LGGGGLVGGRETHEKGDARAHFGCWAGGGGGGGNRLLLSFVLNEHWTVHSCVPADML